MMKLAGAIRNKDGLNYDLSSHRYWCSLKDNVLLSQTRGLRSDKRVLPTPTAVLGLHNYSTIIYIQGCIIEVLFLIYCKPSHVCKNTELLGRKAANSQKAL